MIRRNVPRRLALDFMRPGKRKRDVEEPIEAATLKVLLVVLFAVALVAVLTYQPGAPQSLTGLAASMGLVGAFLYFFCRFLVKVHREEVKSTRKMALVLGLALITVVCAKLAVHVGDWPPFLVPVSLCAILYTLCLGQLLALELSGFLLLVIGLVFAGEGSGGRVFHLDFFFVLVVLFAGALVSIVYGVRIRKRSKLVKVGFIIGLAHSVSIVALTLLAGSAAGVSPWSRTLVENVGWGFAQGMLLGFLISGIMPFIESLFGITTDISLLELSTLNHPLLETLTLRAPGTYHHSMIVGNLAEAGAEAIGANSLLCRVGAYFHDIGKVVKPDFYTENAYRGPNRHEKLSPGMSNLVILAHIKDGIQLARYYNLPQPIVDIIQQHHGDSLVEFFYRKAVEESRQGEEVDPKTFSYPGPKPQTREVGIIALSDSVEAASRQLSDPGPATLENLVHRVVWKKINDHLLHECPLTLREIVLVEEAFTRVLVGIFHTRVLHPGFERKEEDTSRRRRPSTLLQEDTEARATTTGSGREPSSTKKT